MYIQGATARLHMNLPKAKDQRARCLNLKKGSSLHQQAPMPTCPSQMTELGEGVWIGVGMETDEHPVGTTHGIYTSRTVRRKPANERWSSTAVKMLEVSLGSKPDENDEQLQTRNIPNESTDLDPSTTLDPNLPPRRFRIERKHLEQCPYTHGCPRCYAQRHPRPHRDLHTFCQRT